MITDRPRVSAAVLRDEGREILMVKHRRLDGSEYWQLPGGGVLPSESLEHAVLRELREETNLAGWVVRRLFTIPYKYGNSTTFLVQIDSGIDASLGSDPEEAQAEHRKLVGLAWLQVADVSDNPEIRQLMLLTAEPREWAAGDPRA